LRYLGAVHLDDINDTCGILYGQESPMQHRQKYRILGSLPESVYAVMEIPSSVIGQMPKQMKILLGICGNQENQYGVGIQPNSR